MTKHIKEPSTKSSQPETLYLAGSPIDRELSEYLVALAEALEMKMNAPSFMEATDPLDTLGVGLRRLQRHNLEQKACRQLFAAQTAKGEKPA